MNLSLLCFKVMAKLGFGDFQKKNMMLLVLFPTVKHGGGGVMAWGCFTWESLGPLVRAEGTINSQKYIDILNTHLSKVLKGKLLGKNFNETMLQFIQSS